MGNTATTPKTIPRDKDFSACVRRTIGDIDRATDREIKAVENYCEEHLRIIDDMMDASKYICYKEWKDTKDELDTHKEIKAYDRKLSILNNGWWWRHGHPSSEKEK